MHFPPKQRLTLFLSFDILVLPGVPERDKEKGDGVRAGSLFRCTYLNLLLGLEAHEL